MDYDQEWCKWSDSSILISRDPTVTTHDPMSFPTVTICSTNKISKKKLMAALQEPKSVRLTQRSLPINLILTSLNLFRFIWMDYTLLAKTMRYLTKFDALVNPDKSFRNLLVSLRENNVSVEDLTRLVHQVSPTCRDIFLDCQW